LHDGELGEGNVEREGIDQDIIGKRLELFDGQFHGQAGGVVNVDAINGVGVNGGDGPGEGTFANAMGEGFAALRFNFFRIVQAANGATGAEDDGGRHDGPEERTTADFIGARDGDEATGAQV